MTSASLRSTVTTRSLGMPQKNVALSTSGCVMTGRPSTDSSPRASKAISDSFEASTFLIFAGVSAVPGAISQ